MPESSTQFHGIFAINQELIEPFTRFLQERETHLSKMLLNSFGIDLEASEDEPAPPLTLKNANGLIKKNCSGGTLNLTNKQLTEPLRKTEQGFWNYLEVLEGGITELFQQLNELTIDEWDENLVSNLSKMESLITNKLDDLEDELESFEKTLGEYKENQSEKKSVWQLFQKFLPFSKHILDPEISNNLKKSKRFLGERYAGFMSRYNQNQSLNEQAKYSLKKFQNYSLLQALSPSQQETFHFTYRLLKIWEMDARTKAILTDDLIRFAKKSLRGDRAQKLFSSYYKELNTKLFEISRSIKEPQHNIESQQRVREISLKTGRSFRKELKTLERLVARYREFLLRTDPNPYVRARVGFAEWVLGPEPTASKQLLKLEYDLADLDSLYENLVLVLENQSPRPLEMHENPICREIRQVLHSMALPLNTQKSMRGHSETLIELLNEFDELGSGQPWAIPFVQEILEKAIRADWKYHTLHEMRSFHQIYTTHIKLIENGDPIYAKKFKETKDQVQQILLWVKSNQSEKHASDIDEMIEKMKNFFNEMLLDAESARQESDQDDEERKEKLKNLHQSLLQHRYLFGGFFHTLDQKEREGKFLRQLFLPIDRALESIDNCLHM